jgi:hypothetical protein
MMMGEHRQHDDAGRHYTCRHGRRPRHLTTPGLGEPGRASS